MKGKIAGLVALAGILAISSMPSALADRVQPELDALTESLIRNDLIGKNLSGVYRDGRSWRESYAQNGDIVYLDKKTYWQGKWSFRYRAFCTFYNDGKNGACWHVVKVSDNCYQFFVAQKDGRPLQSAEPDRLRPWTAQGSRTDRPGTCGPVVGV